MKILVTAALFVGALLMSCGPQAPVKDNIRDLRVEIPTADPAFLDFVSPEFVIEPGQDKLFCSDIVFEGDDVAFKDMKSLQGKFGHHFILMSTRAPKPPGTTYDCSEISAMKDFEPFAFPLGSELPAGHGSFLPKGKALVMQVHYVNTSTTPIRVRDVMRLKKVAISDVTTWTSMYSATSIDIALPPQSASTKITFDCALPQDVGLLVLGGHMHEWGKSFSVQIGPDVENLKEMYSVPAWKPDFRDSPPLSLYLTNPIQLSKGTVIRTTCEWQNSTDKSVVFPHEMCAAVAVLSGSKEPILCWVGTRPE